LEEPLGARKVIKEVSILLAEDNSINSHIAMRMLSRLGYNPDCVSNGREAIEALQKRAYDIVLMDLQMPEMDGITAAQWIVSHPKQLVLLPNIIAMTANTLPEAEQRCRESGMIDFIAKPIGLAVLADVLQRWSSRS